MAEVEYVPDMKMSNFQNMKLKDFVKMIQEIILEKTKLKPIFICRFPYLSQTDLEHIRKLLEDAMPDYHVVCMIERQQTESKFEVLWEKDMIEETKEELNKIFHNSLQSIKQKEKEE